MPRFRTILLVIVSLALLAVGLWWYALGWRPSSADFPIQGIDVSQETGSIDWPTVRAGEADFAYVRAIRAGTRRDAAFHGHWAALEGSGIRRGALHEFSLCRRAADQARAFITFVPRSTDTLPAAVDLDFHPGCTARPSRAVVLGELRVFLAAVEHHTGEPMLLKVSKAFEDEYQVSAVVARTLWASRPALPPEYLARPWRMWQATTIRRIDGVDRPVHWSVVAP